MARKYRNMVILAALEVTPGVATTMDPSHAYLVSDFEFEPLRTNAVARDVLRGSLGATEQLVGPITKSVSFSVEWAGSGTPTLAPKVGHLIQGCGFASTVGPASVDYTPVSTFGTMSSLTISIWADGERHNLVGARGSFRLEAEVGQRPLLRFRFVGRDAGETVSGNPTPDFSAHRLPQVVSTANTGSLTLGAVTYAAATGTFSGGTPSCSGGLSLDVGNNVVHQALLGCEDIAIAQRDVSASFDLELSATQAVAALAQVRQNAVTALGFVHGNVAGNICGIYAPSVQRTDPRMIDRNGDMFYAFNSRFVPVAGNDEVRFFFR